MDATPRLTSKALAVDVYHELRRVAQGLMGGLRAGQTVQPTALVHEAYLRLTRTGDPKWESRRHFFGAAIQAMREILIESARRKAAAKRGGGAERVPLDDVASCIATPTDDVLAVDEAIESLRAEEPEVAEVVQLRYYTGLTLDETADVLGVSVSSVQRLWRYARAWLSDRLGDASPQ